MKNISALEKENEAFFKEQEKKLNKAKKERKALDIKLEQIQKTTLPHFFLLFGILVGFILNLFANAVDYYFQSTSFYSVYTKVVFIILSLFLITFVVFTYKFYKSHFQVLIKAWLVDRNMEGVEKDMAFSKELTRDYIYLLKDKEHVILKRMTLKAKLLIFKIRSKANWWI